MLKIFRALNTYFLHDEDEAAPVSDYIWFYGTVSFMLLMAIVFIVLNIAY